MPHPLVLAALLVFAASPSFAGPADPGKNAERAPVALFSAYPAGSADLLFKSVRAHPALRAASVYAGSYGVSADDARSVHDAGLRYAPIFRPARKDYPRRRLKPADLAKVPGAFDGPIPLVGGLDEGSQFAWGTELGRRMRDAIRAAHPFVTVDAWQFDEVSHTASGLAPNSGAWRMFLAGAILGLKTGRVELGDRPMNGFVWLDRPRQFAQLPADAPGVATLLAALDDATIGLVGEEYVHFKGDPKKSAHVHGKVRHDLLAAGGPRASLAAKYIAGLTPGYRLLRDDGASTFLGGNVLHKPEAWVNQWRDKYVAERARMGATGFAEFNFTKENSKPSIVADTVAAIAHGILAIGQRR